MAFDNFHAGSRSYEGMLKSGSRSERSGTKKQTAGLKTLPPLPPLPPLVFRRRFHCSRIHAHLKPQLALVLEFDVAIDRREQRVVRGAPHVLAGMELGAALNDDDGPGPHKFPAEPFHAEVLRIRVAPVARGADALLVSHAVLSRPSRRRF